MSRDQLWSAYEAASLARDAHMKACCEQCREASFFSPCPEWQALVAAVEAAREAWDNAPHAPIEALTMWRVYDRMADYGEPGEAVIMAVSAEEAISWFLVKGRMAVWQRDRLAAKPIDPTEGVLLMGYVSG